jgi:hypothetical protein
MMDQRRGIFYGEQRSRSEPRRRLLQVRVSQAEAQALRRLAEKASVPVATLVRGWLAHHSRRRDRDANT